MRTDMEVIIEAIRNGNMEAATNMFSSRYSVKYQKALIAVSDIASNLSDNKNNNKEINSYIVSGLRPKTHQDYYAYFGNKEESLKHARLLIDQQFTGVRISGVIAEAKQKTVRTIDL